MHPVIKSILDKDISMEEKKEEIQEIKKSIELAERIFTGELRYCKKCGDYYLSRSFFTDTEIVEENICTYSDPINSGGDEYERKEVKYMYRYCPKGCKEVISRSERF